jgi:hypothetical protein
VTASPTLHPWSPDALFNKALQYVSEMERCAPDDWRFALWSTLALELLARAAVAYVSPAMLGDGKDWRNVYYALGNPPVAKGFVPMSKTIGEVLSVLEEIRPSFTKELAGFCRRHCTRRNAELHTGEDVFTGLATSRWLPEFYASCDVLLGSMGKGLSELFSNPKIAEEMITALRDTAAKAVRKDVATHGLIWTRKTDDERRLASEQAAVWATRHVGHRVICPACACHAVVLGKGQGAVTIELKDDDVIQRQMALPSTFECIACGLRITGFSKLTACGLGDPFSDTSVSSAAEYFNLHTDEELDEARAEVAEPEYEEDFNEFGKGEPAE